MNGNYGGGWMNGGWVIIIGVLVCFAIVVAVVWLVMRLVNNRQAPPLSSVLEQQPPYQMNGQEYQPQPQESTESYYADEKLHSYPQSVPYPRQQERPVD